MSDNPIRKFRRWLYAGKHPNWIARIANRTAAAIGGSGMGQGLLVELEVIGRKSGKTITLPLAVATIDGQRYVVSMLGEDVQWVLNVRAAGGRAAIRSGARQEVRLTEIPPEQRAPILKAYLRIAPGARPHMPVNQDSSLEEIEEVAAEFPTFRVDPA